jgi:hypothetical protein
VQGLNYAIRVDIEPVVQIGMVSSILLIKHMSKDPT